MPNGPRTPREILRPYERLATGTETPAAPLLVALSELLFEAATGPRLGGNLAMITAPAHPRSAEQGGRASRALADLWRD